MAIEWLLHYAKFNACWNALHQVEHFEELFFPCWQCIAYYLMPMALVGLT